MTFRFVRRKDDELQFKWDATNRRTDRFQRVYPLRLARGAPSGRPESRSSAGTRPSIYSGASWDDGDLLRLNDPDASDFSLRELTATTQDVYAIAAGAVVSGAAYGPEPTWPPHIRVTSDILFSVTDVNGVTPAASYVGQEAALDNSSGWQIDVTGTGDVLIEDVDVNYGVFIVRFLDTKIQENPYS